MAKVTLSTIKNWFRTGLKPTQAQFWDSWDSFFHKDDKIPITNIENITEILAQKADADALANHLIAADAHSALFNTKVNKVVGKELTDNNLTDELLAKFNANSSLSGSRILRGGFAILPNRTIRLFIYEYLIADEYFDTPILTDVQLDIGGAQDRADTVAINNLAQAIVKKGIEGDPSPPDVDLATELFITWRLMKAGATEPEGSTSTAIYNENLGEVGGEWDASVYSAGSINVAGVLNPSSGIKSVTVTNSVKRESLFFLNSVAKQIDIDGTLQLKIFLENAWSDSDKIYVVLYNDATRITANFPTIKSEMYGFDGSLINEHQLISVPFKDFSLLETEFTRIQFFFFPEGKTYSIDEVQLFDATGQPDTGGETSQVISRTSQIPINDGADGDSFYVEDKNLGAAAKSNNYADLDGLPIIEGYPKITFNELIPDNHLPNSTGDIQIVGNALTEEMCLAANLNKTEAELQTAKGLTIEGQTINSANFVNSHLILANVTLGATQGDFDVMGNNGAGFEKKTDAILVVLGDVFEPNQSDWTSVSNLDVSEDGSAKTVTHGVTGNGNWMSKPFDITKDWELRWHWNLSPLSVGSVPQNTYFQFMDITTDLYVFRLRSYNAGQCYLYGAASGLEAPKANCWNNDNEMKIRWNKTTATLYFYVNNVLIHSWSTTTNNAIVNNLYLKTTMKYLDASRIKYIELAT